MYKARINTIYCGISIQILYKTKTLNYGNLNISHQRLQFNLSDFIEHLDLDLFHMSRGFYKYAGRIWIRMK